MVVIRGVTGGTNVPGARSTRGASGGFRVGGGAEESREANASTGVSAATAMGRFFQNGQLKNPCTMNIHWTD
jgi:hypothetical protein